MSTITWPILRLIHQSIRQPTHLGHYIGWEFVNILTDISVHTQPITLVKCLSICCPIYQLRGAQTTHDPFHVPDTKHGKICTSELRLVLVLHCTSDWMSKRHKFFEPIIFRVVDVKSITFDTQMKIALFWLISDFSWPLNVAGWNRGFN